jgi:short-subunit dehydrogenase
MNLKNKVVIVTGASAGIGEATARALAAKGAKVALVARSAEKLAALEKELAGSFAVTADMSKPAEVKKMIAAVHTKMGGIDVLVNNAGQGLYGPVENIDLAAYEKVWALNVLGPLAAMEAIIPLMREQKPLEGLRGMIVNVSSMVSKNYFPYLGGYASTKYALNGLSLTARTEVAKDGIVISVVHPGMTATDFGKNAIRAEGMESMVSRQRENMPAADSAELVAGKIVETLEAGKAAPAEVTWK